MKIILIYNEYRDYNFMVLEGPKGIAWALGANGRFHTSKEAVTISELEDIGNAGEFKNDNILLGVVE